MEPFQKRAITVGLGIAVEGVALMFPLSVALPFILVGLLLIALGVFPALGRWVLGLLPERLSRPMIEFLSPAPSIQWASNQEGGVWMPAGDEAMTVAITTVDPRKSELEWWPSSDVTGRIIDAQTVEFRRRPGAGRGEIQITFKIVEAY